MYASSSKLFFKNTSGTTYDLTASTSRNINILVYTSSATWSPQPGLQYIKVICAGPGGGGGGAGESAHPREGEGWGVRVAGVTAIGIPSTPAGMPDGIRAGMGGPQT
jgi:hypothetical protein